MLRPQLLRLLVPVFCVTSVSSLASVDADAKGKKPSSPVVGVVTEGIAERLHDPPKGKKGKKAKTPSDVGKSFTALCDGTVSTWKVTDLGDDGAWVGTFAGGIKPKRCLLLDTLPVASMAAKGRPSATTAQIAAARAAATAALTPKSGEAPKVEIVVFHDGEGLVAVAQATRPATGKSTCLDHTSLVVLNEHDGAWKTVFKPAGKGKDICGYAFFTRGDVDADGRDEIALRVDRAEGYGYRVLKRSKGTYTVVAK